MKPLHKLLQVAGVQGFEPQLTDPESAVLPLNDTPLYLRTVFLIFPFAWKILHDVAQVVKGGSGRIYKGWRNSIYVSIPRPDPHRGHTPQGPPRRHCDGGGGKRSGVGIGSMFLPEKCLPGASGAPLCLMDNCHRPPFGHTIALEPELTETGLFWQTRPLACSRMGE